MLNKEKVLNAEIKAMQHHQHVTDKTQGGRH